MKTKKNFHDKVTTVAVLLFSTVLLMAFYTLLSFNTKEYKFCHQELADNSEKSMIQAGSSLDKSSGVVDTEKQILDLGKEIAKLEKTRDNLASSLKKAMAERDKNYGMVAGLSYQPSQSLGEVIVLEKKLSKIDHQITAMNSQKASLNNQLAMNK